MECLRQKLVRHRKGRGSADAGAAQVSANMPVVMKQVFDTMSQTTGVDFTEILKANTYDAMVIKNVNLTARRSILRDEVPAAKDTLRIFCNRINRIGNYIC